MRHQKHSHSLGLKKEHRQAVVASLASSLFIRGRIRTTLAKAKALRPFAERVVTLAKKANALEVPADKLHLRRQAIARLRNVAAVKALFDERVKEFLNRNGGYTRIYKIGPRAGDAAEMALIELIPAADEGHKKGAKKKAPAKKGAKKSGAKKAAPAKAEESAETAAAEAPAAEKPAAPAQEAPKA